MRYLVKCNFNGRDLIGETVLSENDVVFMHLLDESGVILTHRSRIEILHKIAPDNNDEFKLLSV